MPFNDKKEWIDPDSIPFDINDRERGYSVCVYCMKAVHLHQAGYEVELHNCNQCKSEVADIEHFLSADEEMGEKVENVFKHFNSAYSLGNDDKITQLLIGVSE